MDPTPTDVPLRRVRQLYDELPSGERRLYRVFNDQIRQCEKQVCAWLLLIVLWYTFVELTSISATYSYIVGAGLTLLAIDAIRFGFHIDKLRNIVEANGGFGKSRSALRYARWLSRRDSRYHY